MTFQSYIRYTIVQNINDIKQSNSTKQVTFLNNNEYTITDHMFDTIP